MILDPATARRRNAKIERSLHEEVAWQLIALKPACVAVPIPNGIYLPARTEAEKQLVRRLISQMKRTGQLREGAPDWLLLHRSGCLCIELKREQQKDLFGVRHQRGRLSPAQKTFAQQCTELGIDYLVCYSWDDVKNALLARGWVK